MTDPIADMLTRVRNAVMRKHKGIILPHSNLKQEMARILKEEDFIRDYKVVETDGKKALKLFLKYVVKGESVIVGLKRVSKPGRRVYVKWDAVPKVKGGIGISILSTSRGLMTHKGSYLSKVGGELLCSVW
ncbi:MAG: 30S ribosomal protein S8 [Nitrospirae bacterium]|nr:30S ribosomal protein S8 [Candidatus Troglogloeales bacterium]MBI3598660.1 30S ribosomal protein S8 [Candidatus Troglogloeales bacterium]